MFRIATANNRLTHSVPLVLLLVVAFTVRFWNLNTIPHAMHRDEVANTYLGRFVLENDIDIYGNSWPIFYINKFGDYPPSIPMYMSGLTSYLTGMNVYASRLPAALFGSVFVLAIFLLVSELSTPQFALTAGVLAAIVPWHVTLSRAGSEGIIALTIWAIGILSLVHFLKHHTPYTLILSPLLLLLTYLLYPSFRLLAPLSIIPFFLYPSKYSGTKRGTFSILVLLLGATVVISGTSWGRGRFAQTSLLTNNTEREEITNDVISLVYDDGNHSQALLSRVFHNKAVGYIQRYISLYLSYFDPEFLFITGGYPRRYHAPHVGLLYLFMLPLLILACFNKPKDKKVQYMWLWSLYLLAITPAISGLTVDDSPNIHRSLLSIVPYILLAALGVANLFDIAKRHRFGRVFLIVYLIAALGEISYVSHQYYIHAGAAYSFERTDGNTELATYINVHKDEYSHVIVADYHWAGMYYLFETNNFDPSLVGRFSTDLHIDTIDSIQFATNMCPTSLSVQHKTMDEHTLYIDKDDCATQQGFVEIDKISRRGGTIAYRIYEYHPNRY